MMLLLLWLSTDNLRTFLRGFWDESLKVLPYQFREGEKIKFLIYRSINALENVLKLPTFQLVF
jgi:hypothetical protein